jgi:hypothetical protein
MDSSIRREDALLFTSIKMLTKYTLYFVSCQADALISRETVWLSYDNVLVVIF